MFLPYFIVLSVVLFCTNVQEGEGNPHFQIDHKSGKLDIMATRTSADIQSTEDYVDLVMKPGKGIETNMHQETSQRHNTPEQYMFQNKKNTDLKHGISQGDSRETKSDEKLLNFDSKWDKLFKFPKGNKTIDTSIARNLTLTNETTDTKEIDNNKMLEVENNAKSLAKMIEDSSSHNTLDPEKIKEAAKHLENQVQNLKDEVMKTFVNESDATEKVERQESSKEQKNKKYSGKKLKNLKNGNCSDCGNKIPAPGDSSDGSKIVPKLTKGGDNNETRGVFAANDTGKEKVSEKTTKSKETKGIGSNETRSAFSTNDTGKENVAEESIENKETKGTGSNETVSYKEDEENKKGQNQTDNGVEQILQKKGNGKIKDNSKEGAKTASNKPKKCKDCGTKIPKVGNKTDDGKLAVPKLTKDNETAVTNGFNQSQAAPEEQKKVKNESSTAKVGKTSKGSKENMMKNGKKPCKNCGGKIAKPGDKTEDEELIVPKLSKTNTTKEHNRTAYHNTMTNGKIVLQNANLEKEESFDLDDDSQEITEDADYTDLSVNTNKHSESQVREGVKASTDQNMGSGDGGSTTDQSKEDDKSEAESEKESHEEKAKSMEGTTNSSSEDGNGKNQGADLQSKDTGLNDTDRSEKKTVATVATSSDESRKESSEGPGGISSSTNASKQVKEIEGRDNKTAKSREKSTESMADQKSISAENQKMKTVKQFNDLLNMVLKNVSTEQKEELLKLTWHDLRAKHAEEVATKAQRDESVSSSSLGNNAINRNGTSNESVVSAKIDVKAASKEHTARKDGYKTIANRIKDKLRLLKDLMDIKKFRQAKKKSPTPDPYAGFKRENVGGSS